MDVLDLGFGWSDGVLTRPNSDQEKTFRTRRRLSRNRRWARVGLNSKLGSETTLFDLLQDSDFGPVEQRLVRT